MPTVITGASGHLGRLVVDQLLATGTPPAQIVATGRDVNELNDLAWEGVTVRRADFRRPDHPRRRLRGHQRDAAGLDDDSRGAIR